MPFQNVTAKSPSEPSAVCVRAAGPVSVHALMSGASNDPFRTRFAASTVTDASTASPVEVRPGIAYSPGPRIQSTALDQVTDGCSVVPSL